MTIITDRSTSYAQTSDISERVTRFAACMKKTTDPVTLRTAHLSNEQSLSNLCGKCQNPVSYDVVSVRCGFCGLNVHADCNETLTNKSLKMINDDRHPSICYQCLNCRTAHSDSNFKRTHLLASEEGNSTERRLFHLEEQLKQTMELVQDLISQGSHVPADVESEQSTSLLMGNYTDKNLQWSEKKTDLESKKQKNLKPKPNIPANTNSRPSPRKAILSVICTNVPEATDTLLANKHEHDMNQWLHLCSRMSLRAIRPVSLIRLSRKPNSLHQDKPRLLKVSVQNEKELEDILLSAYLLRDGEKNSSRVFVGIPWSKRKSSSQKGKQHPTGKHEGRSLVILNGPESESHLDTQCRNKHDFQQ